MVAAPDRQIGTTKPERTELPQPAPAAEIRFGKFCFRSSVAWHGLAAFVVLVVLAAPIVGGGVCLAYKQHTHLIDKVPEAIRAAGDEAEDVIASVRRPPESLSRAAEPANEPPPQKFRPTADGLAESRRPAGKSGGTGPTLVIRVVHMLSRLAYGISTPG